MPDGRRDDPTSKWPVVSIPMWSRVVFGAVLCLLGGVWFGQGLGYIKGSFMTGQDFWTVVGGVLIAYGLFLIVTALNRRRKPEAR